MTKGKLYGVKQCLCFILLAVLLFNLTGCYNRSVLTKEDQKKTVSSSGEHVIKDCIGREVEVTHQPVRVAALDSFAGEALVMIGAGDKMVSAPNGVKMDKLLQKIDPSLKNVAVPLSGGTVNIESLMALKPDLILIKEALYNQEGEKAKIENLQVPYLVVGYKNMEEQIDALQMIGDALGGDAQKKAVAINSYYRNVIQEARQISKKIPKEKRLRVYHSINELVRTDGLDTVGDDWITCVGAIDVSADDKLIYAENDYFASMEQIYLWDPDVVICNEASTKAYLIEDSKWKGLRAVYQNRVYNIPVGATRWGQRGSLETFFAILWLGTTIYPEYYGNIDLKKEVINFYKNNFNLDVDDSTYELILKGEGIRISSLNSGS